MTIVITTTITITITITIKTIIIAKKRIVKQEKNSQNNKIGIAHLYIDKAVLVNKKSDQHLMEMLKQASKYPCGEFL